MLFGCRWRKWLPKHLQKVSDVLFKLDQKMDSEERMRRVALLCCHCLRNVAFYRAGWNHGQIRVARQFWICANSNFIDSAVLEWCKLFAERDGKHHWRRVVADPDVFITGLCAALGMTQKQFRNYSASVQRYRNKFVAHLDDGRVMHVPRMRIVRKSAAYLYNHLRSDPAAERYLADARQSASEFYSVMYRHAYLEYQREIKQ